MRSLQYLNTVLTVLAVLLALQLWTSFTTSDVGITTPQSASAQGIVNGGEQRKQMIEQLVKLNHQTAALTELISSGKVRVVVDMPAGGNN